VPADLSCITACAKFCRRLARFEVEAAVSTRANVSSENFLFEVIAEVFTVYNPLGNKVGFRLMVDMGLCLLKGIKGIINLSPLSV